MASLNMPPWWRFRRTNIRTSFKARENAQGANGRLGSYLPPVLEEFQRGFLKDFICVIASGQSGSDIAIQLILASDKTLVEQLPGVAVFGHLLTPTVTAGACGSYDGTAAARSFPSTYTIHKVGDPDMRNRDISRYCSASVCVINT